MCPQNTRPLADIHFETLAHRPEPVTGLTARALNPYSVRLVWKAPTFSNGIITHYIISVVPLMNSSSSASSFNEEDSTTKAWSVNVAAAANRPQSFFRFDSNVIGSNSSFSSSAAAVDGEEENAIVDNLIGGRVYRLSIVGVTEAGAGDSPNSVEIQMPIAGSQVKSNQVWINRVLLFDSSSSARISS